MILSPCLILKNAKFLMTGICFVRIAWAGFHHHPAPSLCCLYFSGDNIKSKGVLLSGFPCGSACKESAHNVGDLGLIPGLGRSPGEGNGNPLQYSCFENSVQRGDLWAAVHGVAQSRTRLRQLSMHACIGEGNGNPLRYSCLENPRDGRAWWAVIYGVAQSRT